MEKIQKIIEQYSNLINNKEKLLTHDEVVSKYKLFANTRKMFRLRLYTKAQLFKAEVTKWMYEYITNPLYCNVLGHGYQKVRQAFSDGGFSEYMKYDNPEVYERRDLTRLDSLDYLHGFTKETKTVAGKLEVEEKYLLLFYTEDYCILDEKDFSYMLLRVITNQKHKDSELFEFFYDLALICEKEQLNCEKEQLN